MSEVRSICALCQREQHIPEQDNDSHTLCTPHMRELYGDELTDQVLAEIAAKKPRAQLFSGQQVRSVIPIDTTGGTGA